MDSCNKRQIGKQLSNNKGIASLEAVSLLFVFVLFVGYTVGFFGVIHTGILQSIAARAYAWEIFNKRTTLTYHRDDKSSPLTLRKFGFREHAISDVDKGGTEEWIVTTRNISIAKDKETINNNPSVHNSRLTSLTKRESIGVNPIWVKTSYGICLNAGCRPQ